MSDQPVTPEFLGRQIMALTADVRDMKRRVTTLETRFSIQETRLAGIEDRLAGVDVRLTGMMDLLVRLAMRVGVEPAGEC